MTRPPRSDTGETDTEVHWGLPSSAWPLMTASAWTCSVMASFRRSTDSWSGSDDAANGSPRSSCFASAPLIDTMAWLANTTRSSASSARTTAMPSGDASTAARSSRAVTSAL